MFLFYIFLTTVLYPALQFYPFYSYYISLQSIFMSLLGNDVGTLAKESGLENVTYVAVHEERDASPKAVCSTIVSGVVLTHPDKFKRRFPGVDLNHASGSDRIVIKAMLFPKDIFLIPYPYELH